MTLLENLIATSAVALATYGILQFAEQAAADVETLRPAFQHRDYDLAQGRKTLQSMGIMQTDEQLSAAEQRALTATPNPQPQE